jgi:pimeloyl-ACP methyl ester carboxylesterase
MSRFALFEQTHLLAVECGMAAIVLVHGIAQQYLGAEVLRGGLAHAVADGVALAGGRKVKTDEVDVAFYGNLFRRQGTKAVSEFPAAGELDAWESELLMQWWAQAALDDPQEVEPPDRRGTKAMTPTTVQRAIHILSRSRWLAAAGERFLLGVLRQARIYLHDDTVRNAAQQAVLDAIKPETRVVVGHSLGSVVAYEALFRRDHPTAVAFVTLGSPLGIPNLFFDRLRPPPQSGAGQWPTGVTDWTNICDKYDVVALVKDLAPLFARVVDHRVVNGWQAHHLGHYLTSAEVGRAIADGL